MKEVAKPGALEINDETAKTLGLESLERLREIVKGQIESQFGSMTRQKVKRQLLDQLDEPTSSRRRRSWSRPSSPTSGTRSTATSQAAGRTFADEETTEEEARTEYTRLAERRVRLGLVLAEIGEKAGVHRVRRGAAARACSRPVRRFPANQQQEAFEFYRNNPNALTTLRAPLFEEKVIDHLLGEVSVTDKKVTKEELLADDELRTADAKPRRRRPRRRRPKKADDAEAGEADAKAEGEAPKKKAAPKKAKKADEAE